MNQHTSLAIRLSCRLLRDEETGCLNWTGRVSTNGYGRIRDNSTTKSTHRVAWELANGPIPFGLSVLHHCDNRRCCNVEHLFLGTIADNNRDARQKDRHTRGDRHPKAILTDASVLEILAALPFQRGDITRLASRFGVSVSVVKRIGRGEVWRHVTRSRISSPSATSGKEGAVMTGRA